MRNTCAIAALFLLAAADAPEVLTLDSNQSTIGFHARNTFDQFDGKATHITGSLTMRDGKPDRASVEFPSAQLKTGIDGRDRNMDEPKYLDIAKFPTVSFTLDSLDGPPATEAAPSSGRVHGSLHIKSFSLPTSAPVTYVRSGTQIRVTGDFSLDIRNVGMDPPVVAIVQRMDPSISISFKLVFVGQP